MNYWKNTIQTVKISNKGNLRNLQNQGLRLRQKNKRRFIRTRKRAERTFNLFMMRARRPRSILNVWIKFIDFFKIDFREADGY